MRNYYLSRRLAWILVSVSAFAVFYPVLSNHFLNWDDQIHLTANPHLTDPGFTDFFRMWDSPYMGLYIPITYNVWQVIKSLGQLVMPVNQLYHVYHLVNLLVHIASALLLLKLLERIGIRRQHAIWGVLVFLLHPVQVESIAWASELKGLLSSFFGLAFLNTAVAFQNSPSGDGSKRGLFLASYMFLLFSLLSKPVGIVFPLLYFVLCMPKKKVSRLFPSWFAFQILAIPIVFLTKGAQSGKEFIDFVTPVLFRPLIWADALVQYFSGLLIPYGFSIDYGRTPEYVLENSGHIANIVILFALGGLIFLQWKKTRSSVLAMGAAMFFLATLPNSGLIPFAFQNFSTTADRYAYIPMMGVAVFVSGVVGLSKNKKIFLSILSVYLLACAFQSSLLTRAWDNSISIATQAIRTNSRSKLAYFIRGTAAYELGSDSLALNDVRASLAIDSNYEKTQLMAAKIYERMGQLDSALYYYEIVVARAKENVAARFRLLDLLIRLKKFDKADKELSLLEKDAAGVQRANLLENRAELQLAMGNRDKALAALKRAQAFGTFGGVAYLEYLVGRYAEFGFCDESRFLLDEVEKKSQDPESLLKVRGIYQQRCSDL